MTQLNAVPVEWIAAAASALKVEPLSLATEVNQFKFPADG